MASSPEKPVDLTSDSDDDVQCIGIRKSSFNHCRMFFLYARNIYVPLRFLIHKSPDSMQLWAEPALEEA
jgi:hypothetical protein